MINPLQIDIHTLRSLLFRGSLHLSQTSPNLNVKDCVCNFFPPFTPTEITEIITVSNVACSKKKKENKDEQAVILLTCKHK